MAEHDQLFKQLLQEFLPEFPRLFFPQLAGGLDLGRNEWLVKEIFPDPSLGDVYQGARGRTVESDAVSSSARSATAGSSRTAAN
jgi:hypothetical protein